MKKCIIVGAGTYGQVYAQYLREKYEVLGFIDDALSLAGKEVEGYKVLGNVDFSYGFLRENPDVAVFVPIGNNEVRLRILSEYERRHFDTPSFIHEKTIIHNTVTFGKGVYVLPGTNIMPSTNIGDFVMVSMGVNIAHHVEIEKGCFFSQGVNIGASLKIGESCYFGIASTVMTGVTEIGKNCLIGAAALITKNVGDNLVLAGIPAKVLRENSPALLSERK